MLIGFHGGDKDAKEERERERERERAMRNVLLGVIVLGTSSKGWVIRHDFGICMTILRDLIFVVLQLSHGGVVAK